MRQYAWVPPRRDNFTSLSDRASPSSDQNGYGRKSVVGKNAALIALAKCSASTLPPCVVRRYDRFWPLLSTCALQQSGLEYFGRAAHVIGTAVRDPRRILGADFQRPDFLPQRYLSSQPAQRETSQVPCS